MVYSSHPARGWWTIDAWSDCRGQQPRSQWVLKYSEGNKDGQIDHTWHKTHQQNTDNGKAVP